MSAFAEPTARRHLRRLVAVTHPRGPQFLEQLLADVAGRIGGQAAILAALEELASSDQRRRRQGESRYAAR